LRKREREKERELRTQFPQIQLCRTLSGLWRGLVAEIHPS
jgi:hypothetical protein